ncbi:hypothetical protein SEA_PUREGLOBE5_18 [Arthrobacter phage Pureglobe5]|nr:membrane protein [Arthrobacter phage Beagle]UYL87381.1 hypothetical protein SEA_PUREGLOBE5_18 [Arthrobacter phage Pureglobe5]
MITFFALLLAIWVIALNTNARKDRNDRP